MAIEGPQRRLIFVLVITLGIVAVGAVVLFATGTARDTTAVAPAVPRAPRPHAEWDAFDGPTSSVSLSEAMSRLGRTVALPDRSIAGSPTQVILDTIAHTDTGRYGLLVQYPPDVRLFVEPLQVGSGQPIQKPNGTVAGYPARVTDVVMATYEGMPYVLSRARVTWNIGDMNYRLEAATQTVSVERLVEIANSTR